MLLALPPNQKGYRIELCFFLEALRSALTAALTSAELMVADVSLSSNVETVAPCKADRERSIGEQKLLVGVFER